MLRASAQYCEETKGRGIVHVSWTSESVVIDRPCTYAISLNKKNADRFVRACNDQKVFVNSRIAYDVNGKSYVQAECLVLGKYANACLRGLGY
jgi:hypothetical protein